MRAGIGFRASREWICRHIRADRRLGDTLYRYLRRRGKQPDRRAGRHAGRGHIPSRVDIAERPVVVVEKSRTGDRALDMVIGSRHRGSLLVMSVDRGSKYRVPERIDVKTATVATEAITRRMGPFRDRVHTLTTDNGREFAERQAVSEALTADFHFATHCHARECALNEHTNGLVRQYFQKGTDLCMVTASRIRAVEDRISH